MSHRYRCETYPASRLAEIDRAAWEGVCDFAANPFMDLRFLSVLHSALGPESRFWAVLVRDEQQRAVAATYFCTYRIDAIPALPEFLRPPSEWIRSWFRGYLKIPLLIVGQPIGTGQGNLAFESDVDFAPLCEALDQAAKQVARETRAKLILFKEFEAPLADRLEPLLQSGYTRMKSVLTYTLQADYRDFEHYYETRSKRTRANMRKVMAKADEAAVICLQLSGGDDVAKLHTDEVHQLYENVRLRGEMQFEVVPAEFFRELARQFPEQARFTLLKAGEKVVGFCCGLSAGKRHTMLYCGIDYDVNEDAAVYFNTVYRGLAAALETSASEINVGQSADEFKRRMGCEGRPLFMFLKPTGFVLSILFGVFRSVLFRNDTPVPAENATAASPSSADR